MPGGQGVPWESGLRFHRFKRVVQTVLYAPHFISVYVYQQGIESAKYSYSTAVGLFNTAVNIVLLVVNKVASKASDVEFVQRRRNTMAKKQDLSTGMSERTSDIILVAICAVVLVIVAYPLYYVLVASFSDPYEVYAGKTFLLPSGFTLDGYMAVFAEKSIVTGFLNSVKYTVIGTVFSDVMLYITAYPPGPKGPAGTQGAEHLLPHHHVFRRRTGLHLPGGEDHGFDRQHVVAAPPRRPLSPAATPTTRC